MAPERLPYALFFFGYSDVICFQRQGFSPPISERRQRGAGCPDEKYDDPLTLVPRGFMLSD